MATIEQIRQQYPQYNDLSDTQLADSFHSKFYSDIPKDQFYAQLGMKKTQAQPASTSVGENLKRGLASLADVTVGGILPATVQMVGYPLARLGRSPEEAKAATEKVVSAVDQPFGKMLGVAGTPEYQQEAGRKVMDFIGQNFQKGAKWIADKTGLPVADVESYLGTASIAAPVAAKPVAKAVTTVTAPLVDKAVTGLTMPIEQQLQKRKEAASLKDYERGPQIDAAQEAQRLGIFLRPEDIQPTAGPKILSAIAGEKGVDAIAQANKNQIRKVGLAELDLPLTTQLTSKDPFSTARAQVAQPYNEIKKLPTIAADDTVRATLNGLRPDESIIGSEKFSKAINAVIDDAGKKLETGLTGAELLKNIQTLRNRSRKVYNNKSADLAALDWADTNLAIANVLESTIEANIPNPRLVDQFRDARQKMAKSYAYEGATDFNTGMIDVNKLSRITSKDNTLTGDIASLGKIAGNFPDVFTKRATPEFTPARIGRTGASGTLGGLTGYALGGDYVSAALGSVLGAGLGETAQSLAARIMVNPEYQSGLNLKDARIPVNQVAAAMQPPIPNERAIVPYQAPVEVLMPGEGPYRPNFVMQPNQYPPRATFVGPETGGLLQLGRGGTMETLATERQRAAQMSRTLGQQAEQQAAAAEAAARQPTKGAVELQINPLTGAPEISKGLTGATPETFSNFGSSLESAATKVTEGKKFDFTAAEKVAWDRTRVDISEVAPGFKSLSDKEVAAKIADRRWVAETAQKAREKAAAYDAIAQRAANQKAYQEAIANRERMLSVAEDMEESLRKPRADTSRKQQGPKTRTAFREGLFSSQQE
jgi:hypothetical protein